MWLVWNTPIRRRSRKWLKHSSGKRKSWQTLEKGSPLSRANSVELGRHQRLRSSFAILRNIQPAAHPDAA